MQSDLDQLELPVSLRTEGNMTDEELLRFSRMHEPFRVGQESSRDLVVMSPAGTEG